MDPDPDFLTIFLLFDTTQFIRIVVLLVLLVFSALISGSEVALFSLTASDLEAEDGELSRSQKIVARLLRKPKKLLATILIANNFINIAIVLLFSHLGEAFLGNITYKIGGVIDLRFVIEVGLVTFLILLKK